MDWWALAGRFVQGIPFEKLLFPPANPAKELEEFYKTFHAPEPPKGTLAPEKPQEVRQGGSTAIVTREGVDSERMAWQDGIIRGELWLLEGHLKNNCIGCGGDVSCCFKHSQNILDAARETQSMYCFIAS